MPLDALDTRHVSSLSLDASQTRLSTHMNSGIGQKKFMTTTFILRALVIAVLNSYIVIFSTTKDMFEYHLLLKIENLLLKIKNLLLKTL